MNSHIHEKMRCKYSTSNEVSPFKNSCFHYRNSDDTVDTYIIISFSHLNNSPNSLQCYILNKETNQWNNKNGKIANIMNDGIDITDYNKIINTIVRNPLL